MSGQSIPRPVRSPKFFHVFPDVDEERASGHALDPVDRMESGPWVGELGRIIFLRLRPHDEPVQPCPLEVPEADQRSNGGKLRSRPAGFIGRRRGKEVSKSTAADGRAWVKKLIPEPENSQPTYAPSAMTRRTAPISGGRSMAAA